MALREELEKQGQFLFRWRSYLPLFAIPLFALALKQSRSIEINLGHLQNSLWTLFCIAVSFLGLAARCFIAGYVPRGTSGRNTKEQRAECLNTKGPYSIVRNPLYLGNFIITLGIFLFTQSLWFIITGVVGFLWFYERIIYTEEEYLRHQHKDAFLTWAGLTPVLWPKFSLWKKPDLQFSWQTMLRREHSTFLAVIASFTFLHIVSNLFIYKKFTLSLTWIVFFSLGLCIYFFLRFLKKKTKFLNVKGR